MQPLPPHAERLHRKIAERRARVGVVGMGYVGLPLSMTFAERGFQVTAFDVDPDKLEALRRGESYIRHLDGAELSKLVKTGALRVSSSLAELSEQDAVLVCVPTPLTPQREPDMTYVRATMESVAQRAPAGQLVVLESTTYPGTTEGLVAGVLSGLGLTLGVDLFLAYSPEREDPGNATHSTRTIPKLVGGVDEVSGQLAVALYRGAMATVCAVPHARVAEAAKLTENIFRAVNIALVNELKVVYDRMGIDIWQVLDAAETKPFGFMRFNPGPGLGGHCIPLDPFYLTWKAREFGPPPKFIELAGEVNVQMPDYVLGKLVQALNERGKAVRCARILLIGVAYKPDVDDCRESPAFPIMDKLVAMGAEVDFHDPHVAKLPLTRSWPQLAERRSVPLTAQRLEQSDAVVLLTNHTQLDYALLLQSAPLLVDTRGQFPPASPNVVRS